jgi:Superinfection immunity protein
MIASTIDTNPIPPHIQAGIYAVFLLALGLYLLPTVIAIFARHPVAVGIAVLNILLGWTVIGWVAAFVWACIKPPRVTVMQTYQPTSTPPPVPLPVKPRIEDELEALQRLRERKLITEEEFVLKRNRLLDSI